MFLSCLPCLCFPLLCPLRILDSSHSNQYYPQFRSHLFLVLHHLFQVAIHGVLYLQAVERLVNDSTSPASSKVRQNSALSTLPLQKMRGLLEPTPIAAQTRTPELNFAFSTKHVSFQAPLLIRRHVLSGKLTKRDSSEKTRFGVVSSPTLTASQNSCRLTICSGVRIWRVIGGRYSKPTLLLVLATVEPEILTPKRSSILSAVTESEVRASSSEFISIESLIGSDYRRSSSPLWEPLNIPQFRDRFRAALKPCNDFCARPSLA